ncbi:MAG TPA: alpha/beta hydrolase [Gryllotalpicola sp.]
MAMELVSIPSPTTPLDGLYYAPDAQPARNAALLFHGNGMNFYTGAPRFLPGPLFELGLASLAFNRHGHDTVSAPTRKAEGNAYQTVAESFADNELAAGYLAARGFDAPVVIGHSNGGLLAAHYAAAHPETPALVLLSAHSGGREMVERGSRLGLFGRDRLPEISAQAHALVAAGRGDELLIMPGWFYVTTAASFVDLEANTPVLLEAAPKISCPVLYLRGDQENPEQYPTDAFAAAATTEVETVVVPDCDHYYVGREAEVTRLVIGWLADVLGE